MFNFLTRQLNAVFRPGLVLVALCLLISTAASAEQVNGYEEFRISCASCHGISGEGDGSMAAVLTVKPSDLTTLAERHGGKFPRMMVHKTIDGRETFLAHGDRTMPVWGVRYLMAHAVKYGYRSGEQIVQQRITRLVDHIESIQK